MFERPSKMVPGQLMDSCLFRVCVVKRKTFFSDCINPDYGFSRFLRNDDNCGYQYTRCHVTEELNLQVQNTTPFQTPHITTNSHRLISNRLDYVQKFRNS